MTGEQKLVHHGMQMRSPFYELTKDSKQKRPFEFNKTLLQVLESSDSWIRYLAPESITGKLRRQALNRFVQPFLERGGIVPPAQERSDYIVCIARSNLLKNDLSIASCDSYIHDVTTFLEFLE